MEPKHSSPLTAEKILTASEVAAIFRLDIRTVRRYFNRLLKKSEAAFFKEVWRKRGFAKPTEILLSLFVKFPVADSRRLHSPFFNGLLKRSEVCGLGAH